MIPGIINALNVNISHFNEDVNASVEIPPRALKMSAKQMETSGKGINATAFGWSEYGKC